MPFQEGNQEQRKGHKNRPLREILRVKLNEAKGDRRVMEHIADALLLKSMEGDVPAIREVFDRIDGRVPQSIGGSDELPPVGCIVTGVMRASDADDQA